MEEDVATGRRQESTESRGGSCENTATTSAENIFSHSRNSANNISDIISEIGANVPDSPGSVLRPPQICPRPGRLPTRRGEVQGRAIPTAIASAKRLTGVPTFAFFIDFSKAYDMVPHTALWGTLAKKGITGNLLQVIQRLYFFFFFFFSSCISNKRNNRYKKPKSQHRQIKPTK